MKNKNTNEDISKVKSAYYLHMGGSLTMYITSVVAYIMCLHGTFSDDSDKLSKSHYKHMLNIANLNIILNVITSVCIFFSVTEIINLNEVGIEKKVTEAAMNIMFAMLAYLVIMIIFYVQLFLGMKKLSRHEYA